MSQTKCGRCGLPVSPGVCAPMPHVFHDQPEQCVRDLVAEVARANRYRQALEKIRDLMSDRQRFVMQGFTAFASVSNVVEDALTEPVALAVVCGALQ